jgi:transketolase
MTELKSTRLAFGEALLELALNGIDIAAVAADTSKSMEVEILRKKYPGRCFDCGIAEQNMIMVSAGLASTGKTVFATSYSAFTSMRSLEQLRTFVCYPGLNVKVVAGLGGFSAGIEGVTHMALEDIGIVRCIPNLTVICPADYYATKKVIEYIGKHNMPCYVRIGRDSSPVIFDTSYNFKPGKANKIIDSGNEVGIIASGLIVYEAILAAKELSENHGIGIKLIEMPSIKPIDTEAVKEIAGSTKKLVTVEEHSIIGGLHSAVCEVLCSSNPCMVYPVAVADKFTESGTPSELIKKYGLDSQSIISKIKNLLNK